LIFDNIRYIIISKVGDVFMYQVSDFTKVTYKVHEVAEILGVTTKTIRNYDNEGKLKTFRTEGNHRVISRKDLIDFLKNKQLIVDNTESQKRDVIYARVSSHDQKKSGDLDRQAMFLVENASNLHNPLILKEVGSGLNDKRVQLQKLLKMAANNEVRNVYITYKDRLTRFGFHYLETIFSAHHVNIIVVKDVNNEKTVQEELVEDMMSLIASFSGKLYAMRSKGNRSRKGKEKIKNEEG